MTAVNIPWVYLIVCTLVLCAVPLSVFLHSRGKIKEYRLFSVITVLCLCAVFSLRVFFLSADIKRVSENSENGTVTSVTACVTEPVSMTSYYSVYKIKVQSIGGETVNAGAILRCSFESDYARGDVIEISSGEVTLTGMSDTDTLADNCLLTLKVEDSSDITGAGQMAAGVINDYAVKIRNRLACILRLEIGGDEGDLCASMLFGTGDAPDEIKRDFRRSGVSHLLAVSGMHLTVLSGAFGFILYRLGLHRRLRTAVNILAVLAYLFILGFPLSALRSGIMLIISLLFTESGPESDGLTSLSFAAGIILLLNPLSVYDCGFILSVGATFGILVLSPVFTSFTRRVRRRIKIENEKLAKPGKMKVLFQKLTLFSVERIMPVLTVIVSANMITLLPVACFFGEISLFSPVSNLFMPMICEVCLFFCLGVLCMPGGGFMRGFCAFYAKKLSGLMIDAAADISDIHGVSLPLSYTAVKVMLWIFFAVTLVLLVIKLRHRLLCLTPAAVLCAALAVFYCFILPGDAEFYVSGGGNDEYTVLVSDGTAVVTDISSGNDSDVYELTCDIRDYGATETECLIFTHFHTGHIAFATEMLRTVKVRRVYLPQPATPADARVFLGIADAAEVYGADCYIYDSADLLTLYGEVSLELSGINRLKRSTHPVICAEYTFNEGKLLYLGRSFWESDAAANLSPPGADTTVILSSHGPVAKTVSALDLRQAARIVCFDTSILSYTLGIGEGKDYYGKVFLTEKTARIRFGMQAGD